MVSLNEKGELERDGYAASVIGLWLLENGGTDD